jgi:hypothetical protein
MLMPIRRSAPASAFVTTLPNDAPAPIMASMSRTHLHHTREQQPLLSRVDDDAGLEPHLRVPAHGKRCVAAHDLVRFSLRLIGHRWRTSDAERQSERAYRRAPHGAQVHVRVQPAGVWSLGSPAGIRVWLAILCGCVHVLPEREVKAGAPWGGLLDIGARRDVAAGSPPPWRAADLRGESHAIAVLAIGALPWSLPEIEPVVVDGGAAPRPMPAPMRSRPLARARRQRSRPSWLIVGVASEAGCLTAEAHAIPCDRVRLPVPRTRLVPGRASSALRWCNGTRATQVARATERGDTVYRWC